MKQPPKVPESGLCRIELWLRDAVRHCKNPRCQSRLAYPGAATVGRRPTFCRNACRAAFKRDRDKLLRYEARILARAGSSAPESAWDRAQAQVLWALQHYGHEPRKGGTDGGDDHESPPAGLAEPPQALPQSLRCLHPACANPCRYRRGTQGRQRLYCGAQCRDSYRRDRQRLVSYWGDLAWTYQFTELRYPADRIERTARHIEWLLDAYDISDVRQHAQLPEPPREYWEALEARRNSGLPLFISRLGRELTPEEAEIDNREREAHRAWFDGRKPLRRL